jgi:hypothetical protein
MSKAVKISRCALDSFEKIVFLDPQNLHCKKTLTHLITQEKNTSHQALKKP